MAKHVNLLLDAMKISKDTRKFKDSYKPLKTFDNRITPEERKKTKTMFEVAQEGLIDCFFDVNVFANRIFQVAAPMIGEIEFDIDAPTRAMFQAVEDSGIRYGANIFLKTVF